MLAVGDADKIMSALVNGTMKGVAWERLAETTDTVGPRQCGSKFLEDAIDYQVAFMKNADKALPNVHTEPAMVPK